MPRNPFRRADDIPADVLRRVPPARGDKVLAGVATLDGWWVLGTRAALVILSPADGDAAVRVPWQHVARADWDRDAERLRVCEVGRFGEVRPEYSFRIADPSLLLQLVRERVTASVVLQRRVEVSGRNGLTVVARRAPQGDGEITWAYEFDTGVDPDDPRVMEAAERGLAAAAEELGL